MDKLVARGRVFFGQFNLVETLSYTWAGLVGVAIDLVVFLFLHNVIGLPPVVCTSISAAVAATLTFPINLKYTFKKTDNIKKRFYTYLTINFTGLLLGAALVYLGYNILGQNADLVKVGSTVTVAGVQFLLNKFIAFK